MTIDVWRSDDPAEVMGVAGEFLRSEPVLHNLILTLLEGRIAYPEPGRYWVARDNLQPVGVVFQSPLNFPAVVTPMPEPVVDAVVGKIVAERVELPGVNGGAATAARFAGQWTERRGSGARPEMGMRVYEMIDLDEPSGVPGLMRAASVNDVDVVASMVQGFHDDTGEGAAMPVDEWARLRIDRGHVWLWDHGGPVAMAAHTEAVAGAIRIQAVYTPPPERRQGYAGAVVAALSGRLAVSGTRVLLFTDLGNPTSNSVYRRIGFRAVAENLRYRFTP